MPKYAAQTEVGSAQSRNEIEKTLVRYGADRFAYGWQGSEAVIGFSIENRQVKIILPLPDRSEFATVNRGAAGGVQRRSLAEIDKAHDQACRQRWRALALVVKAKLEAVECGISTIEREFLSDVVLPGGGTIGEWVRPQLADLYEHGRMPALLPGIGK